MHALTIAAIALGATASAIRETPRTGLPPPPPIVEPYPPLSGNNPTGNPVIPLSPDPLVATTWSASTNTSNLQRYESTPLKVEAYPPTAFLGVDSLLTPHPNVTVLGPGSLRFFFGTERAGWLEFESADLGSQASAVTASISEYNEPWPGKTRTPTPYSGGMYRLETNPELYEGVTYGWISFDPTSSSETCVPHGEENAPATVTCGPGSGGIKRVIFAEFGTAEGDCGSGFTKGSCAADLVGNVSKACVGQASCTVSCIQGVCTINGATLSLGGDPCPGTPKKLTLDVECAHKPSGPTSVPWHLTAVRVVAQVRPVNYTGSFNSSDPVLTQSWYTGAYGSRLNMMPYGFNSILMDRGDRVSIQGDGHPTMAAALAAFGSTDTYALVHKMLVKTDSGCANQSQCRVVDSSLMPYPLYWASSVNDWYWASGDTANFLALAPDMARIIDNAVDKFLQPNLNVAWFGWDDRVANGFCGSCNLEAQLGFASLTIRACNDFSATLKHAGDTVNASRYAATAVRLSQTLRSRPATTVPGGAWWEDYGVHAAAYMINARTVATPAEEESIFNKVLTNSVTICSWSPFNQYWILQALGNLGKMDYATASIRLCWGPMLSLGKGCFWELFSPEWTRFMEYGDKAPTRPSYCHPWADGVTPWLTHALGGIVPTAPGYSEFAALPHLSASTPTVTVTHPTPHGPITVRASRDGGAVTVAVTAGTRGYVGLRQQDEATDCNLDPATVTLDGLLVNSSFMAPTSLDKVHPTLAAQHLYVLVDSGEHIVTARFHPSCAHALATASGSAEDSAVGVGVASTKPNATGTATRTSGTFRGDAGKGPPGLPDAPPFPPAHYPATWSLDNTTRGRWRGVYGASGYQLFAFDPAGTDVVELPQWVNAVTLWKGSTAFVGSDSANASYLEDPRSLPRTSSTAADGQRQNQTSSAGAALGFATKGGDGSQGTVLDVNVTEGTPYNLTLYMVGAVKPVKSSTWSFSRQAIRVMDLESLNPIAPDPLIAHADGGVYWTLQYTRGVRLRVMPIDSDAGFSAVFFDGPKQ